jgi:hypothetical protein
LITSKCQLVAYEHDILGYITYVFKSLENNSGFGHNYVMVTRTPNWNHRDIDLQEKGYLTYNEVEAGKDKWFCPETGELIPYNYTNIYFIKFVKEQDNSNKDIII